MPNDPPYGGRIEVNKNGSVTWAVSAREYPSYRDVDGTVEYAIRVVDQDRNIITSKDGKCIVHVLTEPAKKADPCDHDAHEAQAGVKDGSEATSQAKHLRFLIVTGYDMPAAPANTAIVGKSYFVTWNSFAENEKDKIQPTYDLILQYDDYDLERAGLPRTLEPTDLHVCHENWIEVDALWKYLSGRREEIRKSLRQEVGAGPQIVAAAEEKWDLDLTSLAVWAAMERHLRDAGVTGDLQDVLELLLKPEHEKRQGQGNQTSADEQDHVWVSRWQEVGRICPDATPTDTSTEPDDSPKSISDVIDAHLVRAHRFVQTPGSRAIIAKGISHKGLFVLMYHGPRDTHSAGNH